MLVHVTHSGVDYFPRTTRHFPQDIPFTILLFSHVTYMYVSNTIKCLKMIVVLDNKSTFNKTARSVLWVTETYSLTECGFGFVYPIGLKTPEFRVPFF